ncbi:TspO/MBR family protein [Rudanella lutea]|uniref:TspO/MBR family protein n=1 Tax=Rudanella lutea TaxID=451374 RepID=UPI000377E501|nr:TspO/MBR family protein [Rudanella lutea]
MNDRLRQFLTVFVIISLLVMNYLSNARVFADTTNGDISRKYQTLITPAGYAFAIWGVIFLGLLAFAVFQALPSERDNERFRAAGPWIILNGIGNAIWSPIFNNEQIGLALLVILVMFVSLLLTMDRLQVGKTRVRRRELWLARVPFSIYFGWLTVATILNVAVFLKSTNFDLNLLPEAGWAAAVLVIAFLVGVFLFNRYRSAFYILVFAWAYAAIAAEQKGVPYVPLFAWAGVVGAVILAGFALITYNTNYAALPPARR